MHYLFLNFRSYQLWLMKKKTFFFFHKFLSEQCLRMKNMHIWVSWSLWVLLGKHLHSCILRKWFVLWKLVLRPRCYAHKSSLPPVPWTQLNILRDIHIYIHIPILILFTMLKHLKYCQTSRISYTPTHTEQDALECKFARKFRRKLQIYIFRYDQRHPPSWMQGFRYTKIQLYIHTLSRWYIDTGSRVVQANTHTKVKTKWQDMRGRARTHA